jgi:hypothetical protein
MALETLRTGNWTFFGVPTAIVISSLVVVVSILALVYRHRPAAAGAERWGDPPPRSEDTYEVDDEETVEVDDGVDGDGDEDADDGADRPHESVPLDPVAVDDQRQDVPA